MLLLNRLCLANLKFAFFFFQSSEGIGGNSTSPDVQSISEMLKHLGGVALAVVIILLIMSVYSIAIMVERFLTYRAAKMQARNSSSVDPNTRKSDRIKKTIGGSEVAKALGSDTITLIINLKILDAVFERIKELRKASHSNFGTSNITIIGLLVGRKAKQATYAYIFLFITLMIYIAYSFLVVHELNIVAVCIVLALIIALFINQKAIEYRIKMGLYGSNEYEVREILNYIQSHADKSNFTNGNKLKHLQLFPEFKEAYSEDKISSEIEGAKGMSS